MVTRPAAHAVHGCNPVHPLVVPFPIAFLIGALATDVAFLVTDAAFFAWCSLWLLLGGVAAAVVAVTLSLLDYVMDEQMRSLELARAWLAVQAVVLALSAGNAWQRADDPVGAVLPGGLMLSIAVVLTLIVAGWLGGELAWRHRRGIITDGSDRDETRIDDRFAQPRPH